ncbi:11442_t:CDS:2 [Ambispora leptoticha]|uniref:11442_t:CDS:1 n=1 Tax=Ambispora leptoticha TaxID=144679 RepID=A0A9N9BU79_9GLOM|nr:11442_t:CDS:2 [Ambispora leptoticha]
MNSTIPSSSNFLIDSATTTPKHEVDDPVTNISNKEDDENTTNIQIVDPINKSLSIDYKSQKEDDSTTSNQTTDLKISSADIRDEEDESTESIDGIDEKDESPTSSSSEKESTIGHTNIEDIELSNVFSNLQINNPSSELPEKPNRTSSSSSTVANHTYNIFRSVFWNVITFLVLFFAIELGYRFYSDTSLRQVFFNLMYPQPIDGPIFRNLANTTTSIAYHMNEIKIPASNSILKQRESAKFLSSIMLRAKDIQGQDSLQTYVTNLGEQLYKTGTATEKLFNVGEQELTEIERELLLIDEKLESGLILSTINATYFFDRTNKIFDGTTILRDLIETVYKEVIITENIYLGYQSHLQNGFLDLKNFFDRNEAALRKLNINVKFVKEDLADFDRGISKILDAKGNIKISLDGMNHARTLLIEIKGKFSALVGRKIYSVRDSESIQQAIENVKLAKQAWKGKDSEAVLKRIEI